MKPKQQKRFDTLYQRHLRALKLQGLSDKTIDVYARAVRRLSQAYDCCPDQLTTEQLEAHFAALVESHSWSTVKVDRNGLQFFFKHVLHRDWSWIKLIKAPKIQSLPDILSLAEVEQLIGAARKLRYRVFLLTTYSMGLRLGETLTLEVGDIDAQRERVHIRRGKGHKDRLVPGHQRAMAAMLRCRTPAAGRVFYADLYRAASTALTGLASPAPDVQLPV